MIFSTFKYLSLTLAFILLSCLLNFSQDHVSLGDFIGCVGTTADLVAICIPDSNENAPIRAMFIGRQRIRITKATRDSL